MTDISPYVNEQKQKINTAISCHLERNDAYGFTESATYTVYPEGHRYRSLIGLEIYKTLGGVENNFYEGVVGLEFIHHASLVFDDLPCMDNSPLRKGKPTAHRAYGEATAILGGLYLWEKGRHLIYTNARQHNISPGAIDKIELLCDETIIGLIAGQELDLKPTKSEDELRKSIYEKNRLFHLACILPAYLLNKPEYIDPLSQLGQSLDRIGKHIAVAYQLFDDLRDVDCDVNTTGKPTGIDKHSSIKILGYEQVKNELVRRRVEILEHVRELNGNPRLERIIEHILTTPS